jgi:transaldolase
MITVTEATAIAGALERLADEGVSVRLDDLSRERIGSGGLAELVEAGKVVGVTTNPSIFQAVIASGAGCDEQLADLAVRGVTVEDPAYKDTPYVDDLVAPGTVNTMPEATLNAVADHGAVTGDTVTGGYAQARAGLAAVERLGISCEEVVRQLEDEGVAKFKAAWQDLLDAVTKSLNSKGVDA